MKCMLRKVSRVNGHIKLRRAPQQLRTWSMCALPKVVASQDPVLEKARRLVPPLQPERYKGQAGKIGVIGGCSEYTGAPFYAAIAALKTGSDLSHVFCARGAASVIKSYSPELIVHPYLLESHDIADTQDWEAHSKLAVGRILEWLPRLSCLVIGPGLGRDPFMLKIVKDLMLEACEQNIPMVVDADGLWIWSQPGFCLEPFQKSSAVVLTPNVNECRRLAGAHLSRADEVEMQSSEGSAELALALGEIVLVEKGSVDRIYHNHTSLSCHEVGSLRRCGGQGDVLSGIIATFLSWGFKNREKTDDWKQVAAYAGCVVTRRASKLAFAKYGRAMVGSDLIDFVGPAFREVIEDHH